MTDNSLLALISSSPGCYLCRSVISTVLFLDECNFRRMAIEGYYTGLISYFKTTQI
jgi:hypothetical protein